MFLFDKKKELNLICIVVNNRHLQSLINKKPLSKTSKKPFIIFFVLRNTLTENILDKFDDIIRIESLTDNVEKLIQFLKRETFHSGNLVVDMYLVFKIIDTLIERESNRAFIENIKEFLAREVKVFKTAYGSSINFKEESLVALSDFIEIYLTEKDTEAIATEIANILRMVQSNMQSSTLDALDFK